MPVSRVSSRRNCGEIAYSQIAICEQSRRTFQRFLRMMARSLSSRPAISRSAPWLVGW